MLRRFGAVEDDQKYTRLVELFSDDAVYYDPFFGPQRGREAIRSFMGPMEEMVPASGATFNCTSSRYGRRTPFLSTAQYSGLRSSRTTFPARASLRRNGPLPTMVSGFALIA